jgi:hypothetical protein
MTTKGFINLLVAAIVLVICSTTSSAGWLIYHKPEFRGKVIDAETEEPMKGAVIVVMYESSPIISGPGGGSTSIIHIKESSTDETGIFVIPAYTTLIQPNSIEGGVEFIIYKPGYGNFPDLAVTPKRHFINPEEYFSRELGTKGEVSWGLEGRSKRIPVTFGVVELPKLETKEERLRAIPSFSIGYVDEDNAPLLYKAMNEELKRFGSRPMGRVRE